MCVEKIRHHTLCQTGKHDSSPALDDLVKKFPALAQELDRIKEKSLKENFLDPFELAKAGAEEYLDKLRLIHAQLKEDQGTSMPTVRPPTVFTPAPTKGASGMKTPSVSELNAEFEKTKALTDGQVSKGLAAAEAKVKELREGVAALSGEMRKWIVTLHDAGQGNKEISDTTRVAEDTITAYLKQVQEAAKSNKEAAKEQKDYKKEVADWNKEVVNGTRTAVNMIRDITMIICISIVMFIMNWRLACIALVPLPILAVLTYYRGMKMQAMFGRLWTYWSRLTAVVGDALPGVKVIKAFSNEQREIDRFDRRSDEYTEKEQEIHIVWTQLQPIVSGLMQLGTAMVWLIGGWMVIRDARAGASSSVNTVGMLTAFTAFVARF